MDKFLGIATEPETDSIPRANSTIGVANRQKPVKRKYNAEYTIFDMGSLGVVTKRLQNHSV